MIAVVGGLGAACAWAATAMCAARAVRLIGIPSVLAWVMLTGLAVTLPWAASQGAPDVGGDDVAWLLAAGIGNCVGLLLIYSGLRIGKVGVIAPIASTEGAIAAVIALLAGEALSTGTGIALGVVATGIALVSATREPEGSDIGNQDLAAALFGGGAAVAFGTALYATGRVGQDLPVAWAILPPRVVGVLAIALPLLLVGRLRITRAALPFVVAGGLAEVVGFACFALGARHGIVVSAVLASQFGAVAAIASYVLFQERLGRVQALGVAAIAVGVAAVSALQA